MVKKRWNNKNNELEDESHVQYLAAMKIFEGRDFKQEKANIMDQVDQLENLAKVS